MSQLTDLLHLESAKRGPFYIACADWNFAWTCEELRTVRRMVRDDKATVQEIARELGRDEDEVGLLIYDLYGPRKRRNGRREEA